MEVLVSSERRGACSAAELDRFANLLEKTTVDTVESGSMTKDLALLVGDQQAWLTTEGFLDKVSENLDKAMGAAGG